MVVAYSNFNSKLVPIWLASILNNHIINMKTLIFTTLSLAILQGLVIFQASAKVDIKSTKPYIFPKVLKPEMITSNDVSKIIPTDIAPDSDSDTVAKRIIDNSISSLFNSQAVKESLVGGAAHKVQNKMKVEAEVKTQKVNHKFSVKLMLAQAIAKVEYKGWVNALVNYDTKQQSSELELSDKVFTNKDLYFKHQAQNNSDMNSVGIRWNW